MTVSLPSPVGQHAIRLTFWLPLPPQESSNASYSGHWATKRKKVRAYFEELDTRQAAKLHIPLPPPRPFERAQLTAVYHWRDTRAFMDRDGRTARLKRVLDWLVRRGYVIDDDDEHLEYDIPGQQVRTADTPALCSLYVTLTPLSRASAQETR